MVFPIAISHPEWLLLLLVAGPVFWVWRRSVRRPAGQGVGWRERTSLGLRLAIVTLLVLCLAGAEWVRAGDELAVVMLLDVSDSVDAAAREQGLSFVREALSAMGPRDRAALVVFGGDAWVEQPMGDVAARKDLETLFSAPDASRTDVAEAVRLGLGLLPAGSQHRLVLLSDGQINVPGAHEAAALAAAGGATLDAVPLHSVVRISGEAWLEGVEAPAVAYEGETVGLLVRVRSDVEQAATLRVLGPGGSLIERELRLRVGANAIPLNLAAEQVGFAPWTVQLLPTVDQVPQNNVLGAFTVVHGAPEVLLVSAPDAGEAQNLLSALESVGLRVVQSAPARMPADLAELGSYGAVVLVNVPAASFSTRQMTALAAYVGDLGRGLVCVGGESSYGVGGYYDTALERALPVEMTIRDRTRLPPLAIAFVVDRSGSMDTASREGSGVRKVDLAKEAVLRSLELLKPGDQVGVIAFSDAAQWVFPASGGGLGALEDRAAVQSRVATLRAGGGTDIHAGLRAAVSAMERSDAQVKHVILLTDGGASQEGLAELAARLRASSSTLSTVGVGRDAASFLPELALQGGGRYHYTDDPTTIPRIFSEETTLAQRAYLVEETFTPVLAGRSAIVEGLSIVPPLHGYVATSIKSAAQMILASEQDDPILAQWQYGLGRSVAWTSDAKGRWAADWMRWEGAARFWGQAVRWTLVERDPSGFDTRIAERGERIEVTVDVDQQAAGQATELELAARFVPALSQGRAISVTLRQVAPGRYRGDAPAVAQGTYLVQIADRSSDSAAASLVQTTGFVLPYSAEYHARGTDEAELRRLAEIGGGRVLDPEGEGEAARVFAHDLGPVRHRRPAWPWLAAAAICLLPLDIGVRRVAIEPADVRRALCRSRDWLRQQWARLRPAAPATASPGTSRLLAAKRRAPVPPRKDDLPPEVPAAIVPERAPSEEPQALGEPPEPQDEREAAQSKTVARLLEAKRRAGQGDEEGAYRSG